MAQNRVSLNFNNSDHSLADQIAREIVNSAAETGEYRGMGGHEVKNHGGHGPHSQISIGVGGNEINIRKLEQ